MSRKITAQPGREFEVQLQGMPGAGYSWQLESGAENVEVVQAERVASPSGALGAASQERFVLKAHEVGDFVLTFGLKRPWEAESENSETVHVHVAQAAKQKPASKASRPAKKSAKKVTVKKKATKRSK